MKKAQRSSLWLAVAVLLAWAGVSVPLHAQKTAGTIQGTVTDSSGGLAPNVKVTATNTATNVSKTATTSAGGTYLIPNVDIGTYEVTFELQGFEKQVVNGVLVVVATPSTVDARLTVGAVTQSVTVTATAVPITKDEGDRGTAMTKQAIMALPLTSVMDPMGESSRDLVSFVFLTPGVTGNTFTSRVNGGATYSEDLTIDGQPFYFNDHGGAFEIFRPVFEGVDEFTAMTNVYSAKFGRGTGSFNFHLASGTNAFHGDVFEFVRNNVFDARGFYSPDVIPYRHNEFGVTAGGPVYIPKVYDGRDKTFWHFAWSGFRLRGSSSASLLSLPTAEMLQGNFTHFNNAAGNLIPIYDPATTRSDGAGGLTRDQFQCNGVSNVICPDRFSPISNIFTPLMPASTLPGLTNNAVAKAAAANSHQNDYTIKIDHTFTEKYAIHGSYVRTLTSNGSSPAFDSPLASYGYTVYTSDAPRVALDMSLRPNLQNAFSAGWTIAGGPQNLLPINTSTQSAISPTGVPYPAIDIAGLTGFGTGGVTPSARIPSFGMLDNLTWIKGRNQMQFGVDVRWEDEVKRANNNYPGVWSFANTETSLPDSPNFSTVGSSFASYLLGLSNNFYSTDPTGKHLFFSAYRAFYFQDDIKVSRKLTLNLGVRYDIPIPIHEKYGRISTFDPSIPNPGAGGLLGALIFAGGGPGEKSYSPVYPTGASLGSYRFSNTRYYMWQPRFGFAYQVNPKTVVRGGFGLSYFRGGSLSMEDGLIVASYLMGWRDQVTAVTPDNGVSPALQWDGVIPHPTLPAPSTTEVNGQGIDYWSKVSGKAPYHETWSFTVERQLPGKVALEASYVGSGDHLLGAMMENLNQLPDKYLGLGSLLTADINSPAAQAAGIALPFPGFTGPVSQALRPYPQYLGINSNVQETGNSTYHSLQVRVQKYYTNGMSFLVSYTGSKLLTDTFQQFATFNAYATTTYNQHLEKGLGPDDQSQRLVTSGSYELPIGPGKRYLNNKGPVGKVAGGWNMSTVLSYFSGTPIAIGGGMVIPNYGGDTRPDLLGGKPLASNTGNFDPNADHYLNASDFAVPVGTAQVPYRYGSSPRLLSATRGFPTLNENFAVVKRTYFGKNEYKNFEFRAEFFNIFNRVQFGNPNGTVSDTIGFGLIGNQANAPRIIQFGFKLNW